MQKSIRQFLKDERLPPSGNKECYVSKLPHQKITIVADTHPSTVPFIYNLCSDEVLGANTLLEIALYDEPSISNDHLTPIPSMFALSGFPLLWDIYATEDGREAFTDADVVVFLEGRKRCEDRKNKIIEDYFYFKPKAKMIAEYSKDDAKLVFAGNDSCLYAYAFSKFAPKFSKNNITGVSRHIADRAATYLAKELKICPGDVCDVIVVGKNIPDVTNVIWMGRTNSYGHRRGSGRRLQTDDPELLEMVRSLKRPAVVKAKGMPEDELGYNAKTVTPTLLSYNDVETRWLKSELFRKCTKPAIRTYSFASALSEHIKRWVNGSLGIENMIVLSDGSYGVPEGYFCSFPVMMDESSFWCIMKDFSLLTMNYEILQCQLEEIQKDYCTFDAIYTKEHEPWFRQETTCDECDTSSLILDNHDEDANKTEKIKK